MLIQYLLLNPWEPTVLADCSVTNYNYVFTVSLKFTKPNEHIKVIITANRQVVKGLEAEKRPMLKNTLFSSPI